MNGHNGPLKQHTQVQARIAGLELQTTVETPELQQLGLRLELDKATGKMKVGGDCVGVGGGCCFHHSQYETRDAQTQDKI